MIATVKQCLIPFYRYLFSSEYREFMSLRDRYEKVPRFQSRSISFLDYKFEVLDCLSFVWQFKDIFVDKSYRLEPESDSPLIYDCGANIGMSCLYFKKAYPDCRIKAFEADPKISQVMERNLKNNGIDGVEIISKAVWINYEGVDFGVEGADGGSIYLGEDKRTKVGSVRLRDWISKEHEIELLKMDIEGPEVDVISDCSDELHKVKNIFVEYHSWNNREQQLDMLLSVLSKSGFRYHIQSFIDRVSPFINREERSDMDLQLNIFAYKR
jgi:FkbM family methyltransferase